jgi:hypothetical protein
MIAHESSEEEELMSGNGGLHVQGIEVTQAVQYYRSEMHLIDPLDRAPDNAARLVAHKSAWVRVYVRSGTLTSNVTGTLRVERYLPESFLAELKPQPPGTVTAFPEPDPASAPFIITSQMLYWWERSNLSATLNFIIPAVHMCGYLRLTARVSAPDGQTHEMMTFLNVTLQQHIRFRAIMIGYKGKDPLDPSGTNDLAVNPPTLADLHSTSRLTLQMYPVAFLAESSIADTKKISFPLGPLGCDGDLGWTKLMLLLNTVAKADGPKPGCIYYGLIAPQVPGAGGCGDKAKGVAAGYVESPGQVGAEWVMAHEIGHLFQDHAPCGDPGGVDPNYPTYEPYSPASIGEYGLNITTGEVMSPDTHLDIMSYCKPQWISPYGHKLRINNPLLNPKYVCDPKIEIFYPPRIPVDVTFPFVQAKPRPIISIVGIQDLMGKVTIEDVFRTVSFARPRGVPTSLIAVLDGADGQALASVSMFRLSGAPTGVSGCGCCDGHGRPPFLVEALLPDVAPGTALRVLKDGEEIWHRAAPSVPPRVTELSAEISENKRLGVRWRAGGPRPDHLSYWVRWSDDRGETWNCLGTGITETEAGFALEGLPAGSVHLQVVAHDGFFSVASEPVALTLPTHPPIVSILHPREGSAVAAGGTLHLWAATTGGVGQVDEPDDYRWLVDGREVGRGLEVWMTAPDAGEHRCTLRLEGDGERIQRTVPFKAVATPCQRQVPWAS